MDYPFVIPNVTPNEYGELKKLVGSNGVIRKIEEGFHDGPGKTEIGFKYDIDKQFIGIFVKRNGLEELVLHDIDVSEYEKPVVQTLQNYLIKKLDGIRIGKDNWIY